MLQFDVRNVGLIVQISLSHHLPISPSPHHVALLRQSCYISSRYSPLDLHMKDKAWICDDKIIFTWANIPQGFYAIY